MISSRHSYIYMTMYPRDISVFGVNHKTENVRLGHSFKHAVLTYHLTSNAYSN